MPDGVLYGFHPVMLPHEGKQFAIFYALKSTLVVATCKADPWGPGCMPFLSELHVAPNYRRQGIARELVRLAQWASLDRGMTTLAMWVHDENKAAEALYRGEGFQPFYRDGHDLFFAKRFTVESLREERHAR